MKTDLEALFNEVRLTLHVLVRFGERLHEGERVTLGMRAILERLLLRGPATVPAIARDRRVTRQHVQALVNALLEQKLVELAPNAAHKRSPLVSMTSAGERLIRHMKEKEGAFLSALEIDTDLDDVSQATSTLRAVRAALERKDV